jgi:hypothetical protein
VLTLVLDPTKVAEDCFMELRNIATLHPGEEKLRVKVRRRSLTLGREFCVEDCPAVRAALQRMGDLAA